MLAFLQSSANAEMFFRAKTAEDLCAAFESRLNGRVVQISSATRLDEMAALANRYALPRSELWFCSYAEPLTVRFPESDFIRVQFGIAGTGATRIGRQHIVVEQDQACVTSGATEIGFGRGFKQVVWRIGRTALNNAMATLANAPITRAATFEPTIDLSRAPAKVMLGLLRLILQTLAAGTPPANRLLAELEQALIVSFLSCTSHNYSALLERSAASPASWQVRRAEDYIVARWDQPLSIEEISAATGASARSLFRAFKRDRGCSPLEYVRRLRLQKAHAMLQDPDRTATVTSVAFDCGYNDLAHFSRDFAAAYGERPSDVLGRRRRARALLSMDDGPLSPQAA